MTAAARPACASPPRRAAIDGIPAIIIDPKGDLANLG
jgi:hypothetical protein